MLSDYFIFSLPLWLLCIPCRLLTTVCLCSWTVVVVLAFVRRPPHCDELCSQVTWRRLPGLWESQQASLLGEGEQGDPVGVHRPLDSAHPQQLLLIEQRVGLNRKEKRMTKANYFKYVCVCVCAHAQLESGDGQFSVFNSPFKSKAPPPH